MKLFNKIKSLYVRSKSVSRKFNKLRKDIGFKKAIKSYSKTFKFKIRNRENSVFFDVIIINGCDYSVPHPIRYRVDHQLEQLSSYGLSCLKIDRANLKLEDVVRARNFIIFRYPYDELIGEFIDMAKKMNKKVYFDIDDLVIDTKYTNQIPFVDAMAHEDKSIYDDGVIRMGKTLKKCGSAITTCENMKLELEKYVDEVFINRNVASMKMLGLSQTAIKDKQKSDNYLRIGYFSGSITHNDDVALVLPAICSILKKYNNVHFCVVGEADLPEELNDFTDQVEKLEFADWHNLPKLISNVDINIVPLRDTIFNRAKSENKWVEASLVKVPTVASNVGSLKEVINNKQDGLLCDNTEDWVCALELLINDEELRNRYAENAFNRCSNDYITLFTSKNLGEYITNNQTPNILFLVNKIENTGGCMVIRKHAAILQDHGYDVSFALNLKYEEGCFCKCDDSIIPAIPVLSEKNHNAKELLFGTFDQVVATFWLTMFLIRHIPKAKKILYLVQNYEVDFYENGTKEQADVYSTYMKNDVKYITISKWCQDWLKSKFNQDALYAPNGLNTKMFKYKERNFDSDRRIRVLIEGDCTSIHKNVDEAFKIANKLDKSKFEVWYLSYGGVTKKWYKADKFISNVPYQDVPDVYAQCDILLKTSLVESFSYPPLEMMATGGFVVALPNGGNIEYLEDESNCLFYEQGNFDEAVECINNIVDDKELRNTLSKKSQETVNKRDWDNVIDDIVSLYNSKSI